LDLLSCNCSFVFVIVLELLSTLFHVLSQEVYGSVHIDGTDERDQLEVELLCAEREQEWTVLEDLLQR
jgi:hypothetical protein